MRVVDLSYSELVVINGGHNGASYNAGKRIGNKIKSAWCCVKEFVAGAWEGITS